MSSERTNQGPRRVRGVYWAALVVTFLAAGGYAWVRWNTITSGYAGFTSSKNLRVDESLENHSSLRIGERAVREGFVRISLQDLVELDFKSKREVLDIRAAEVARHPELIDPSVYRPSGFVFGRIRDGHPWWGIQGQLFHGKGPQSINGPAEESRQLVNPYLLVGVIEHFIERRKPWSIKKKPYPEPLQLVWAPSRRWGQVVYDVEGYLDYLNRFGRRKKTETFLLETLNAQDLGFWWFCIDPRKSLGLVISDKRPTARKLRQFIHLGGSCAHPQGCNNASPRTPELEIEVAFFPALVTLKLWSRSPESPLVPADMVFEVVLTRGGLESPGSNRISDHKKDSWSPR